MKIFYAIGDPGLKLNRKAPIGNIVHIISMIESFRKLGCEVISLIAGENAEEKKSTTIYKIIERFMVRPLSFILRDSYKILYNYKFYKFYKNHLKKTAPDLIYERNCFFHFGCSMLAKNLRIPYIMEINSPPEAVKFHKPSYLLSWVIGPIQKWAAKNADAIIVISSPLHNYFINKGITPEKIYVLPNGVDCELFDHEKVKSNIRAKYNLGEKIVVGYVGSTNKYQRLDFLIETAKRVVKDVKNIHFLVVGPIRDKRSIDKLLKRGNMSKYFTFIGGVPHEEMPQYISAIDIGIQIHSNSYRSPIKIFAYGAMGKAVIAPNFEAIREISLHEENILLFKNLDAEDFANCIIRLAEDPELRKRLGNNLKEHICKNHTWQKNAERVLQIYDKIAKEYENDK